MTKDQIPLEDILATVAATNSAAVVACIHDRTNRAFDVRCSIHGGFFSIIYGRGTTINDRDRAHVDAAETCFKHAATCEATS